MKSRWLPSRFHGFTSSRPPRPNPPRATPVSFLHDRRARHVKRRRNRRRRPRTAGTAAGRRNQLRDPGRCPAGSNRESVRHPDTPSRALAHRPAGAAEGPQGTAGAPRPRLTRGRRSGRIQEAPLCPLDRPAATRPAREDTPRCGANRQGTGRTRAAAEADGTHGEPLPGLPVRFHHAPPSVAARRHLSADQIPRSASSRLAATAPHPGGQSIGVVAGVDDDRLREIEVVERRAHGSGDLRRAGALDLDADPPATASDEQVQLRTAVRRPEMRLIVVQAQPVDNRLQNESLPGSPGLRMGIQGPHVRDAEQYMQHARITQVDLRSPDLSLGDVRVPGLQLSHHNAPVSRSR